VGDEITGLECLQTYLATQDFEEAIGPALFLGPGEFMRVENDAGTSIVLGHCDVGEKELVVEFRFDTCGRLIGYGARNG